MGKTTFEELLMAAGKRRNAKPAAISQLPSDVLQSLWEGYRAGYSVAVLTQTLMTLGYPCTQAQVRYYLDTRKTD